MEQLDREQVPYTDAVRRFPRSKLHDILKSRAYIGEVRHHDQWYPGQHEPLVDRRTFQRVQTLLSGQSYRSHELTYASGLITCAHCGHPITGERKTKQTKSGPKDYVYYRCTKYARKDHPRVRVTEAELEAQVLALFDRIRIDDEEVRDWFGDVLRARARDTQQKTREQVTELNRQLTLLSQQQDELLNLRLMKDIDEETFASKSTELRDRIEDLKLQLDLARRGKDEQGEIAVKAFELSQTLREKWLTADYRAKRQILGIICLNCTIDGASLAMTVRKPFDVLTEGLASAKSRVTPV